MTNRKVKKEKITNIDIKPLEYENILKEFDPRPLKNE